MIKTLPKAVHAQIPAGKNYFVWLEHEIKSSAVLQHCSDDAEVKIWH